MTREAVPVSDPAGAGMRQHLRPNAACGVGVGAAETSVSVIPLFGGLASVLLVTCKPVGCSYTNHYHPDAQVRSGGLRQRPP